MNRLRVLKRVLVPVLLATTGLLVSCSDDSDDTLPGTVRDSGPPADTGTSQTADDATTAQADAAEDAAVEQDAGFEDTGFDDAGRPNDTGVEEDVGFPDAGFPDMGFATDMGIAPLPVAFSEAEVQMLLNVRCAPCHIGGASGGLSLTRFTTSTINVPSSSSLDYIEPGDRQLSYLFRKVEGTHLSVQGGSGARMPRSGPILDTTTLERLGLYIDEL